MRQFRSNGKLLLTAEYLIVDGAIGLALPTRFGQEMHVESNDSNTLSWHCFDPEGNEWLKADILWKTREVLSTNDASLTKRLMSILEAAATLSPLFNPSEQRVTCYLEFSRDWGLGSSSTLICNVAQWAGLDPMALFEATSTGSGYDIACGSSARPILYGNNPLSIESIKYQPSFADNLFFVHLNQKQKSDAEVASYGELKKELDLDACVAEANRLTSRIQNAEDLATFEKYCLEHELLISTVLQRETISDTKFFDYQGGIVKSLGAWGGDFVLVTGNESTPQYFTEKGYSTVLSYSEIVL